MPEQSSAIDIAPVGEGDWVVEPGDSLVSIAHSSGHVGATIWEYAANAPVREARDNPEVLLPGDRISVPPVRPKSMRCAAGQRHVFRRLGTAATVTLILEDEEGEAFAGKKYELAIDGEPTSGTTGDDGKIECAISPVSRRGTLRVWIGEPGYAAPLVFELGLGELAPAGHLRGAQQRLYNLGLSPGPVDGRPNPETARAIGAFQALHGLEETGSLDEATVKKLTEVHRS